MSTVPPAPPGEVSRWHVIGDLHGGIAGTCCMCPHTTAFWWCDRAGEGPDGAGRGASFYPLHERCADKLIEAWQLNAAEGGVMGLTGVAPMGAYAKRAAQRGARQVAHAISTHEGSPYFRPGMPKGQPWVAAARMATGGVTLVPCGPDRQRAVVLVATWHTLSRRAVTTIDVPRVGGCVVGPDATVYGEWGLAPVPGSSPPWEPVRRVQWTQSCTRCGARLWAYCWRGETSGACLECLRREGERPWWPTDPPEPMVLVPRRAKEKPTTFD